MSGFPTLKTGAVAQYPAERRLQFSTDGVRFVDGSGQRYQNYAAPVRRWVVKLDLLDENEMQNVQEFFRSQRGASGTFAFADPWDGTPHPSCSFDVDGLSMSYQADLRGQTQVIIRENRSS